MKTHGWAIFLAILTTLFTSVAQVFYKMGANKLKFDILALLTNYDLLFGFFLYALGAAIMIISFRGGEVTVLYPIIATSYIWVSLLSSRIFGEIMNIYKWLGIALIILGIVFISYGSKQKLLKGAIT